MVCSESEEALLHAAIFTGELLILIWITVMQLFGFAVRMDTRHATDCRDSVVPHHTKYVRGSDLVRGSCFHDCDE